MKRFMSSVLLLILAAALPSLSQQKPQRIWSDSAKPIVETLRHLRSVPDDQRGEVTRKLALQIRALPASQDKSDLALHLAGLSTEGDFGAANLQEVTTTLAATLKDSPAAPEKNGEPNYAYSELASLVRYEHMKADLDDPQYKAAMSELEAQDQRLQSADFKLTDLKGKTWDLRSLRGKVVLVNFWATWCPPCRKEMPDLEALSTQYEKQGLIVLGITDEPADTIHGFLAKQNYTYPILFDPERQAAKQFGINGIPKSFVYDRDGKLVAQSIDMRTRAQFQSMLAEAGLK